MVGSAYVGHHLLVFVNLSTSTELSVKVSGPSNCRYLPRVRILFVGITKT